MEGRWGAVSLAAYFKMLIVGLEGKDHLTVQLTRIYVFSSTNSFAFSAIWNAQLRGPIKSCKQNTNNYHRQQVTLHSKVFSQMLFIQGISEAASQY